MQTRLMVERIANADGISYRAGDEAHNFVRYLTSPYFRELYEAADYLTDLRRQLGRSAFEQLVEQQLERWAIQFQSSEAPGMAR
jgi:hypothetical protein